MVRGALSLGGFRRLLLRASVAGFAALIAGCGGGGGGGLPSDGGGTGGDPTPGPGSSGSGVPEQPPYHVFVSAADAVSWVNAEHATFGMLPPHTVLRAQVVQRDAGGKPALLDASQVELLYEPVADTTGSINSKSVGKTDLWSLQPGLPFGVTLGFGRGLLGLSMPGDAPTPGPQLMPWSDARGWFEAAGLPLFPMDDAGVPNEHATFRVTARDKASGTTLGQADLVVAVSSQNGCVSCHATGGPATGRAGIVWSTTADAEKQAKENVLRVHDAKHGTHFGQPGAVAVCTLCHDTRVSRVLGIAGSSGLPSLSAAIHRSHAGFVGTDGGAAAACGQCHPAAHLTQGAMGRAGLSCGQCHGDMAAVGATSVLAVGGSLGGTADGALRRSWVDEPRCESCHTGDALDHLAGPGLSVAADGLRLTQAYLAADAAASPLRRDASRFGSGAGTRYRDGRGHSGLACAICHGTSHAEWSSAPGAPGSDTVPSVMQGHPGAVVECDVCHVVGSLPLTTQGPHGLHNVGDPRWAIGGHGSFYAADPAGCQACHGKDLAGTVLSRAATERVRDMGGGHVVTIAKGQAVGCGLCHASHDTSAAWVSTDHGPRFSVDPLGCEGCHGTDLAGTSLSKTVADRSYSVAGKTVNLPTGTVVGCATCHVAHDASLAWVNGAHGAKFVADRAGCTMCHGADLAGTASSKAAADRAYTVAGTTYRVAKGTQVSCTTCHITHDTSQTWVAGAHGAKYTLTPSGCSMCHGADLAGTALTKAAAARSYTVAGKTYAIASGTQVGCTTCHVAHSTALSWVSTDHKTSYTSDPSGCAMCHGADLAGTAMSKAAADRSYTVSGKTYLVASGVKVACATCHVPHATTSTWVTTSHGSLYESDPASCKSCHGATLAGTVLSKTAASRSYTFGKKTVTFAAGTAVACATCHVMHATTSTFAGGHPDAYNNDPVSCKMCHGHTLSGTSLSVTSASRTVTIDGKSYTIPANTKVACDRCHQKP